MVTKKTLFIGVLAIATAPIYANFFADIDSHFKQMWHNLNTLENEISSATKNSALSVNSSYDSEKNAVIIKIKIPGLTEKDVAFDVQDNQMTLKAKSDTHESLIVITEQSILVEQTEYEELTNKAGKAYTFITGHNRVVNSLPHGVVLQEAQAEYENGVLTITIPSNSKKMVVPITHKRSPAVAQPEAQEPAAIEKKKKTIVINSKKKQKEVEQDIK